MRIAVLGSGAIGCLVAGYLKLKGEDVSLVGRQASVKAIKENGLKISGVRGNFKVDIQAAEFLNYAPELVILATKTQDIEAALKENLSFLKNALLLTTQNGLQADGLAAKYINKDKIISSIVMFGATYLEPGRVIHNFEGDWVIGSPFGKPGNEQADLAVILNKAFSTTVASDLKGMKLLKVFTNANNCIPAILGKSMQEVFSDIEISCISIAIWKEGLEVVRKSGFNLVSLPGFPVEKVTGLTSLPTVEAAKIFSGVMSNLSKEPLYGSILQSIMRGRSSEIDYINGEFVRLGAENKVPAALNKILVDLVHQVEKTKKYFSKEELINRVKGLVN